MICRICGCDLTLEGVVACGSCQAPFHRDCWEFNGGCGIYGCGGKDERAWEGAPSEAGALEIREGTEPAFRVAPYVERLVRRLPRWGRTVVPPVVVAALDGLLVLWVGMAVLGVTPSRRDPWIIWGLVAALVFLLTALAPLTRRRPFLVLAGVAGGSVGLQVLFGLSTRMNAHTETVILTFLFGIFATAGVLSEVLVMRLRAPRNLGTAGRTLIHGLTAMGSVALVCLGVLMLGLVCGLNPHCEYMDMLSRPTIPRRLLFLSIFGLAAVAPTLALAVSPLMHRLKAEARREADES